VNRGALVAGLLVFVMAGTGTALFQEGAGQDKKSSKEPWVDEIVLAVSEAGANAVIHSGTPQVHVSWRPFGDRVEVPDDADLQTRVLALLGRRAA